jgi:hypothetical protein
VTFDAGELFRALARHDVAYVTIGGMAVQAYGGQRVTQDLDVTIASSSENYARLATSPLIRGGFHAGGGRYRGREALTGAPPARRSWCVLATRKVVATRRPAPAGRRS